jgi:hypothetical protein
MSKAEKKRKPSYFLEEAFQNIENEKKKSAIAESASELDGFCGRRVWSCRGCGETDMSHLAISSDKSGYVCDVCGTCDLPNMQEKDFDTKNRTTCMPTNPVATELDAQEFKSAVNRRKERVAREVLSHGVPSSLRGTHDRIARQSVKESSLIGMLPHRDRKRMDKTIIHIHSTFNASGLNPDSNPLCIDASNLASLLFAKTASHIACCPNSNMTCFASLTRQADAKLIGNTCIKKTIDEARRITSTGNAFQQIGPFDVREMTEKLTVQMSAFLKLVSVVRDAESAVDRIVGVTAAQLCLSCDKTDECNASEDATGFCDSRVTKETEENDTETSKTDEFLHKVSVSVESAKMLGWVDEKVAELVQRHVRSVSCYDWVDSITTWPPDLVTAVLSLKASGFLKLPISNLKTITRKIAKKHNISNETVQSALDSLPCPSGSGAVGVP